MHRDAQKHALIKPQEETDRYRNIHRVRLTQPHPRLGSLLTSKYLLLMSKKVGNIR